MMESAASAGVTAFGGLAAVRGFGAVTGLTAVGELAADMGLAPAGVSAGILEKTEGA